MLPARYFPLEGGRYEVKPGLFKFGTPFGNGVADEQVFQIDNEFPRYQAVKLAARQERLAKYFQTHDYWPATAARIERFIVEKLTQEHPNWLSPGTFNQRLPGRSGVPAAIWTGEIAAGTPLLPTSRSLESSSALLNLDALALHVQEDLAIIQRDGTRHWLAAVHLCFPNHWAAEEKIGRTFAEIHAPVAGIDSINRQADKLVDAMIKATDGLVRFAWGLSTDDELNHHPENQRRPFDPQQPRLFLRIERQTIWGFPEVDASLFTIRTCFEDVGKLKRDEPQKCACLIAAIQSMSPASLAYKGLTHDREAILTWLGSP